MAADGPGTRHPHPVAHMLRVPGAEVLAPPLFLLRDRVVPTCQTGELGELGAEFTATDLGETRFPHEIQAGQSMEPKREGTSTWSWCQWRVAWLYRGH